MLDRIRYTRTARYGTHATTTLRQGVAERTIFGAGHGDTRASTVIKVQPLSSSKALFNYFHGVAGLFQGLRFGEISSLGPITCLGSKRDRTNHRSKRLERR